MAAPFEGEFPPRSLKPLQDKPALAVAMAYTVSSCKERNSATVATNSNNNYIRDVTQKKKRRMLRADVGRRTKLNLPKYEAKPCVQGKTKPAYNVMPNQCKVI